MIVELSAGRIRWVQAWWPRGRVSPAASVQRVSTPRDAQSCLAVRCASLQRGAGVCMYLLSSQSAGPCPRAWSAILPRGPGAVLGGDNSTMALCGCQVKSRQRLAAFGSTRFLYPAGQRQAVTGLCRCQAGKCWAALAAVRIYSIPSMREETPPERGLSRTSAVTAALAPGGQALAGLTAGLG